VASLGALVTSGQMAGYITSKTDIFGLTRSMALDYGPYNRVNTYARVGC
jgi:NAD(P)-dependent dehydrogenase (short-subunit alcohol dehydrogenase family)